MYLLELRMARKDRLVSVRSLKYLRHFNEQSNGSKLIFIHFIYPPFFHTFISHSQTPSLCKSPIRLNRSFSFLFVARPPPLPLILPNLLSILLFNFRRYFVSFVLFPVCFVFWYCISFVSLFPPFSLDVLFFFLFRFSLSCFFLFLPMPFLFAPKITG